MTEKLAKANYNLKKFLEKMQPQIAFFEENNIFYIKNHNIYDVSSFIKRLMLRRYLDFSSIESKLETSYFVIEIAERTKISESIGRSKITIQKDNICVNSKILYDSDPIIKTSDRLLSMISDLMDETEISNKTETVFYKIDLKESSNVVELLSSSNEEEIDKYSRRSSRRWAEYLSSKAKREQNISR